MHIFLRTMCSSKLAYEYIRLETLTSLIVLDGKVLEFYNVHGKENVAPEG